MTEPAHSTWSASATERNWSCAGAIALTDGLPDTSGEAAEWGTCAHTVAERCLTQGVEAEVFIGQTIKAKKLEFEVDEEMVDVVQAYVDYVRSVSKTPAIVEQKFTLAELLPPFDAGGTADAVIYDQSAKTLEVVDLKTGRGVRVSATENKQLRTYALGAMLANKGLDVEYVKSTIVQPRTDKAPKSETYHVVDLMEWTTELLKRMKLSKQAKDEYADVTSGKTPMVTWAARWLSPGDHCGKTFCKAAGFCPALQQKALDAAGVWFDDLDKPRLANSPDSMSPEALATALDAADMISDWINAVRAYAHAQAETGVEIPNYVLVPKEGRETWNDDKAGLKAAMDAIAAGLEPGKVYNPAKVRTPKQLRDALAKAKLTDVIKDIAGLSSKPDKGTNLVRADKTTRPAVAPAVNKHFSPLD